MSETTEELCSRLGALIDEWNSQFSQSHTALTEQVVSARSHLERLAQPPGDDVVSPEAGEEDASAIAILQEEIIQLKAALKQAQSPEPPLVGAPISVGDSVDSADCEEWTPALAAELAQFREEAEMLKRTLATRDNELAALRETHGETLERLRELEISHEEFQSVSALGAEGAIDIKAFDTQGHKKRMGEILLELGVLDEEQLKGILKEQSLEPQHRLGALVVAHGYTGEDIVSKILAAQLRLPYVDVRDETVEAEAVALVSAHVTQLHHCLPLREVDGILTVAMVNPLDLIAIEDLELASQRRVSPVVSTRPQIEARLAEFYGDPD